LPAKLEKVAIALSLDQQKDMVGHALMMKMAKPRKARKGEDPNGVYWVDDPESHKRLGAYWRQDVRVERAIVACIGFISPEEQAIWFLDAVINDRSRRRTGRAAARRNHRSQWAHLLHVR
jgi:DNA polymerase bacteriophage-type